MTLKTLDLSEFLCKLSKHNFVSMVVKFVWFALICCSAANGVIWYFDELPWMLLVLLIGVALLIVHRAYTKNWCTRAKNSRSDGVYGDYDEDHPCMFMFSFLISVVTSIVIMVIWGVLFLVSMISSVVAPYLAIVSSCFVGSLTALVFFTAASCREWMYA